MHRESSDEIAELAAKMMSPHADLVTDAMVTEIALGLARANGGKEAKAAMDGLQPLLADVRRVCGSVVSQADGPEHRR